MKNRITDPNDFRKYYLRKRYLHQLENRKKGKSACENLFDAGDLHNGIVLVLGEELTQKFIREAHEYIAVMKEENKRSQ